MVSFAFAGGRSFLEASRGSDSELNVVVVDDLVRREAQRRTSRVEGGISLGRKELFRSFLRRRKWD